MSTLAQVDRDLEIYLEWTSGQRQRVIAERRGLTQQAISEAISRARSALPPVDRAAVLDQSIEALDNLLAVYLPMALDGDKAAARVVDRILGRRGRYLGLETPQKIELAQAVAEVKSQPAEPLQVVIERILARQGRLREVEA